MGRRGAWARSTAAGQSGTFNYISHCERWRVGKSDCNSWWGGGGEKEGGVKKRRGEGVRLGGPGPLKTAGDRLRLLVASPSPGMAGRKAMTV